MALTSSTMLQLGTLLPPFELEYVQGSKNVDSSEQGFNGVISNTMLSERPLLLMVLCAHCPFVKHIELALTSLDQKYSELVEILAIGSNSFITHPQDSPEKLACQARKNNWTFPYLIDHDQSLAKALRAACTPDFFVFSSGMKGNKVLRYRGQFDESRPGNELPVTGKDLRDALDAVLAGKPASPDQKPSIGCNIKWHPGHEPAWFG